MTQCVAVFGASGRSGSSCVERALSRGWRVRCLSRSPLPPAANKEVLLGSVLDPSDVRRTLVGADGRPADAVVVALGSPSGGAARRAPTLYADALRVIVREMKDLGVRRLVYLSAFGVGDQWREMPCLLGIAIKLIRKMREAYADHAAAEAIMDAERSALDVTVVKPPALTDAVAAGDARLRRGSEPLSLAMKCSRGALGRFMFDVIERREHVGAKVVVLTSPA